MPRPGVPAWLRRGLEAGLVASVVAVASLVGNGFAGGPVRDLPAGVLGAVIVAPGVLALGVVTTAYPVAMAATRSDALLGAIAAFLVAADVTLILAGGPVRIAGGRVEWPVGFLVAAVAILPAIVALSGSQLVTPFGFGRRAGAWTAAMGAIAALVALGVVVALV